MPNSLKSTLEYFAGKPNLASQVKLQKLDKAGLLWHGNKDITFHTIFYTMTNKGVMRWSLLTILPFVVLAIISSQVRMTQSSEVWCFRILFLFYNSGSHKTNITTCVPVVPNQIWSITLMKTNLSSKVNNIVGVQCGNLKIFLPLRFDVKLNLAILLPQKLPFWPFCSSLALKITKFDFTKNQ